MTYSVLQFELYTLPSKNYQVELTNFALSHPLSSIIMGSRKDDPHCSHLAEISSSDVHKGYPAFNRVNPIINWSY